MEPDLQPVDNMTESDDTSGSSVTEEETSWITWFCSLRGNEYFCEVDEAYIHDEFNLTGLAGEVAYYEYALDTLLDADSSQADMLTEEQQETVDAAAELLYGLIHARYILSAKGLAAMHDKFRREEFGHCPRLYCDSQPLLPVGTSDTARVTTVALYCPRCKDLFQPKPRHGQVDAAYFGTTFPHLFLLTYPACVPAAPRQAYVPRVFGFRLHASAGGRRAGGEGGAQLTTSKHKSGGTQGQKGTAALAASSSRPTAASASLPPADVSQPLSSPSQGQGQGAQAEPAAAATGGGQSQAGVQPSGRALTTVLPHDPSGHRLLGRDGRLLNPEDDFFDEEDAPGGPQVEGGVPASSTGSASRGSQAGGGGVHGASEEAHGGAGLEEERRARQAELVAGFARMSIATPGPGR